MRVCPPPPLVPRLMVTNSRKVLRAPMVRRVRSPWYFRSCGARPIEPIGKKRVSSPTDVHPSMTTPAPMSQRSPMITSGPITALGPITVPSPTFADACTVALGWMKAAPASTAISSSASATVWSPT